MEAKVRSTYRWSTLIAFSGKEFVKSEFRFVPKEYEAQAKAHEGLEVREAVEPELVQPIQESVLDEIAEVSTDTFSYEKEDWKQSRRHRKPKVEE